MANRAKRRAANKRIKVQKQRERAALAALREPPVIAKKYRVPEFTEMNMTTMFPNYGLRPGSRDAEKCRSGPSFKGVRVHDEILFESDEDKLADWSRREAAAKKESDRKKKCVAPLFSKGAYQYLGDAPEEIIKGLGRKL